MEDNHNEELKALTQLVSYQLAINILPFDKKYSEFIHYGLQHVVRASKCRVCLFFTEAPVGDTISKNCKNCDFYKCSNDEHNCNCLLFNEKDIVVIPIQTIRRLFGYISLNNSQRIKPTILASIRNFANIIAVNIENKQRKDKLEAQNTELLQINDELRRAKEKTEKSKEQFHSLFNNMSEGVALHELEFLDGLPYDYRIIDVNPQFDKILGVPRKQVVGKLSTDVYHSETPPYFNEYVDVAINKKIIFFETFFAEMDKHFAISVVPWQENGFATIFNDITERKLAEIELFKSNENLSTTLYSIGDGVISTDASGNVVRMNPVAEKLCGIGVSEAKGKPLSEILNIINTDTRKKIDNPFDRVMETGGIVGLANHTTLIAKDGNEYQIADSAAPIMDKDSSIIGVVIVFSDVTEKYRNDLVIIKNASKLQQINAEKDKFFSIIAHDLKSPFNSIIGFSNILVEQAREKNYEAIVKYAEIIGQSSNRAMDLLMNLMEWSQSQTGRMEFNPEYFELADLIKDTILLLSGVLEQKSISISNNAPANLTVFADKKMIGTVLRNLISNAIKFTHPQGKIMISVEEKQHELLVSVSDTGVGISKERIDKLFRIDESHSTPGTQKEKGTGLGLILCKEFIEKNNGKIWVVSEKGKGSTFYFTLPEDDVTNGKDDIEKILPKENVHNNVNQKIPGLKILIVDDDDTSQQLISIMVQKFSKELLHALTGIEAVDACRLNPSIDLILMDIKMPVMGGLEAARQIRKFNKEVIIIAQTAHGLTGDKEKALDAGCNDYISKPIQKDELLLLIQKYFEK